MGFIGWPLGLLLSGLASIFGIVGKLFLKLAHNEREKEEENTDKDYGHEPSPSSKMWFMYFYSGLFSMLIMNPALGAIAYCFASQSLLAPMAGLSIGWNTLFGPLLLPHERLTTNDFLGAILIFTGCVLVGVSATHETPPLPVEDIVYHFFSASFIVYLVFFSIFLGFLLHYAKPALQVARSSTKAAVDDISPATPFQSENYNLLTPRARRLLLSPISRVSISVLSGVIAGQLFFLAATMKLIHDSQNAYPLWTHPITYICIFGAISTALLGLYLLNAALKVEDAVVVIYLYEASYILSGAISGLSFFQDMNNMSAWHYILYALSLVLILFGIYVVARREGPNQENEAHLLPLLVAPPTVPASNGGSVDVKHSKELLFEKSAYYASRKSSSPRKVNQSKSNIEEKRRKSMPQVV